MIARTVVIDCFPEAVERYRAGWAVVSVDVIRATTTAVTAVAAGRRCIPVPSLHCALGTARALPNPLLVGELEGEMPSGFELNNSPAELALRDDPERPMVLLSSSGTRLICATARADAAYVACLRNYVAVARDLAHSHSKVAVIGAGSRGSFREEDQLCCAWIARRLVRAGFQPHDSLTASLIRYWERRPLEAITMGDSARYLQRSGQSRDLEFVLTHVDDLQTVCRFEGGEVTAARMGLPVAG